MEKHEEHSKLKKGLGFFTLIAIGAGSNIGASFFITPTVMAGITGNTLPLSRILAVLPVFLIIPAFMMLGSAYPTSGGIYRYGKLVSPRLGAASNILVIIGRFFNIAMMATGLKIYTEALLPGVSGVLLGVLALSVFFILNILGVKIAGVVQGILFAAMIIIMAAFTLPATPYVEFSNLIPLEFKGGIYSMVLVSALTFQMVGGGLSFVDVGDDVEGDGGKMFLKAIPYSLIIVAIAAILIEVIAVGALGSDTLAASDTLQPLAAVIFPKNIATFIIMVGAMIAVLTSIHGLMMQTSRKILATAEDDMLPGLLYKVNDRFGTPHWALTVVYVVCLLIVIFDPGVVFLSAMYNVGLILSYLFVAIAAILLQDKYPELYARSLFKPKNKTFFNAYTILGCILMVILTTILLVDFGLTTSLIIIGFFIASMLFAGYKGIDKKPAYDPEDLQDISGRDSQVSPDLAYVEENPEH